LPFSHGGSSFPWGLSSGGSSFIYRRNGRVFSSLTGRAGGLLNSLVNRGHAAIAIIGCSFCLGGRPRHLGVIQGGKGTFYLEMRTRDHLFL